MGYPDKLKTGKYAVKPLVFKFPYVEPNIASCCFSMCSAQTRAILTLTQRRARAGKNFAIKNLRGDTLMTKTSQGDRRTDLEPFETVSSSRFTFIGEQYSALIEPLFKLPTKLPITAWEGHIPFLFVLFRLVRPMTYVELGVHNGASFIAACSAAATYNLQTEIVGVDTWKGDTHAGFYGGEIIYQDLKTYLDAVFPKARLERCTFFEATERFERSQIDILHIDGLHTYDAVKEDFFVLAGPRVSIRNYPIS